MKHTISVVISAYNEGAKLERCLTSVAWADEIVVVDNSSVDDTAAKAGKFTKHVYERPNHLMLNRNKNFGFEKATGDWILNLDADEVVTAELRDEILSVIKKNEFNGYWIARKNIIFGKWITHGFWWPDRQLRLFRRGKGKFPCRYIHEYIKVEGPSKELVNPYVHYNYETVSQYMTKLDRCTTSESHEMIADGYVFRWMDMLILPVRDFIKVYFSQCAYKDGLHGLVLAILQTFYTFTTMVKIWELQKFVAHEIRVADVERTGRSLMKELKYWKLTTALDNARDPLLRFVLRIQRKLLRVK